MDHQVGAPIERPAEIGRGQCVVDDDGDSEFAANRGDHLEVNDHTTRIGKILAENELDLVGHRGAHVLRLRHIDEMAGPPELGKALPELGH